MGRRNEVYENRAENRASLAAGCRTRRTATAVLRGQHDPLPGWPDPQFLLEFDLRACKQLLSWHRFALWNGPRTFIFPGKKRTPRMHQQYFQGVAFAPKHE